MKGFILNDKSIEKYGDNLVSQLKKTKVQRIKLEIHNLNYVNTLRDIIQHFTVVKKGYIIERDKLICKNTVTMDNLVYFFECVDNIKRLRIEKGLREGVRKTFIDVGLTEFIIATPTDVYPEGLVAKEVAQKNRKTLKVLRGINSMYTNETFDVPGGFPMIRTISFREDIVPSYIPLNRLPMLLCIENCDAHEAFIDTKELRCSFQRHEMLHWRLLIARYKCYCVHMYVHIATKYLGVTRDIAKYVGRKLQYTSSVTKWPAKTLPGTENSHIIKIDQKNWHSKKLFHTFNKRYMDYNSTQNAIRVKERKLKRLREKIETITKETEELKTHLPLKHKKLKATLEHVEDCYEIPCVCWTEHKVIPE